MAKFQEMGAVYNELPRVNGLQEFWSNLKVVAGHIADAKNASGRVRYKHDQSAWLLIEGVWTDWYNLQPQAKLLVRQAYLDSTCNVSVQINAIPRLRKQVAFGFFTPLDVPWGRLAYGKHWAGNLRGDVARVKNKIKRLEYRPYISSEMKDVVREILQSNKDDMDRVLLILRAQLKELRWQLMRVIAQWSRFKLSGSLMREIIDRV